MFIESKQSDQARTEANNHVQASERNAHPGTAAGKNTATSSHTSPRNSTILAIADNNALMGEARAAVAHQTREHRMRHAGRGARQARHGASGTSARAMSQTLAAELRTYHGWGSGAPRGRAEEGRRGSRCRQRSPERGRPSIRQMRKASRGKAAVARPTEDVDRIFRTSWNCISALFQPHASESFILILTSTIACSAFSQDACLLLSNVTLERL